MIQTQTGQFQDTLLRLHTGFFVPNVIYVKVVLVGF